MSNMTFRKAGKYVIVCLNGKINEEISIILHASRLYEMLSSTFTNKSAISSATSENGMHRMEHVHTKLQMLHVNAVK